MKCDMHVHTVHSGLCTIPFFRRFCQECYTTPDELYSILKRRGMSLVTVTDHDSIGACDHLRHLPDFFLSEELTVILPSGCEAHIGVYDITERHHIELARRASDMPRLLAYLEQERLLYSINHMFSGLTGRRVEEDFLLFAEHFPAIEVLNGAMPHRSNRTAASACDSLNRIGIGGSDSHGVLSLGRAWTHVPGARNKQEFFAGLRARRAQVAGESGSYFRLCAELLTISGHLFRDKPWTLGLAPLIALVPLAGLINYGCEISFESYWRNRWRDLVAPAAPAIENTELAA